MLCDKVPNIFLLSKNPMGNMSFKSFRGFVMKNRFIYSLLLSQCLFTGMQAHNEKKVYCGDSPRPMRVVARHIEANGIGYNQGYTTLEGFFSPLKPLGNTWVPFLDLRGHAFNNGKLAANAGLGLRYIGNSRVWGINAYYDYRNTTRQHYNQVAMGLETLGRVWDFRLNGYLPVGDKTSRFYDTKFSAFSGNQLILSRKRQFAMKGANAEAGLHVDTIKHVPFYFAAGPYYLEGQGKVAWGGELRAVIDLYDFIRLEGNTSYDKVFKWIGQGQVSIMIPFGSKRRIHQDKGKSCSLALALSERALQRVDRFEIIPIDSKRKKTTAIDPATGNPYVFWFVNNTSHSAGTFESPFKTLAAAESASSPYDVIYVFPGDGTSTGMSTGITLQNNQKLFGASVVQTLPTTLGTIQIPTFASLQPVVTNTNSTGVIDVVLVQNNNEISGLCLNGGNGDTIGQVNSSINNLTVANNTILNGGSGNGITLNNASGFVTIANNNVNNFQGDAIQVTNTGVQNAVYSITDNLLIQDDGTYGINLSLIDCSNTSTFISGNTILPTFWGIWADMNNTTAANVSNPIIIQNNAVLSNNYEAVYLELDNYSVSSLVIQNNSFASGNNGGPTAALDIELYNNSVGSMVIQNNKFISASETGVFIYLQDSATIPIATIQNNNINSTGYGIYVNPTTTTGSGPILATLNILNNTINAQNYGIYLQYQNTSSISTASIAMLNNTISGIAAGITGINSSIASGGAVALTMNNNNIYQNVGVNLYFNNAGTASASCIGNNITSSAGGGGGGGLNITFDTSVGPAIAVVQSNTMLTDGGSLGITGNNAMVTVAVSDNVLNSAANGAFGLTTSSSANVQLSGYITNNQFSAASINTGLWDVNWHGTISSLNVADNTFTGQTGSGFVVTGPTDVTIQNNTFVQAGMSIIQNSGFGKWHVVGNTFTGQLGGPFFASNETNAASMCIRLNDNTTNLYPQAYTFSTLNAASSTIYYEPLQGNVGQVVFQGAGTFTEVPVGNCD